MSSKLKISEINTPCRKTIYHSREDAEDMIKHIAETRITKIIKAYRCTVCGFWHLTSRTK